MTEPFHIHEPVYRDDGIGCRGCDLWVPKPAGMPNYVGVSMATWQTWAELALAELAAEMTRAGRAAGWLPAGWSVVHETTPLPSVHGKIPEV